MFMLVAGSTLLPSENSSGMCAQLRTVAANNNRVHLTRSLHLLLVCSTHMVLFFAHIPFVMNCTFNTSGEVATVSKMLWSQMNAVSNERDLKWIGLNCLHTCPMMQASEDWRCRPFVTFQKEPRKRVFMKLN